jgi:hypothetical protein
VTEGALAARDGEVSEFEYFAPAEMPKLAIPYPPSLFQ